MPKPWPDVPLALSHFRRPPTEFGILPFWFLNGELDPGELRFQLEEFRDKGMPGIILHGRFGLEMPHLGPTYLERIQLIVDEAARLGLKTWIYDEMNWPSGTADGRVLRERPDLAQRYIECINFRVLGPWFTYLIGADSRYFDFERSTPVAAFALGSAGQIVDLTPNLSFANVIPWQAPPGEWQLVYIVEKQADYYVDALNPEATAEFLRLGYEPYARAAGRHMASAVPGFYTDEPAMHYYLTGNDNPIVPWTKGMFSRFQERNGYSLRPRLLDLFFPVSADSARVRYDFYGTLTDLYSDAFYRQAREWCHERGILFTGHLLYEEWLRKQIRAEGNLYKHYVHMDIPGVDHLYPIIGNRDRPDEHVAIKVASSAAHQLGRERLLCESFGGIFMDATMQRMKWIADWEYVLGVNLLNPHGFHYTLEGPRKRDWPPSMFYQYPWWHYYGEFSRYIGRLSYLLTGGRHVAKVAILWPINAMFATYTPQSHDPLADRTEHDFNALTDLLLRLHYDFDYLDEDLLAAADLSAGTIRVADETYELLILPPMTHLKLTTVERLEQLVAQGGRLLGLVFLPDQAFGPGGLVDVSQRMEALFGVDPRQSQRGYRSLAGIDVVEREHDGGGKAHFVCSYALARGLPFRLQQEAGTVGCPESPFFVVEPDNGTSRHYYAPEHGERLEITPEVVAERGAVAAAVQQALQELLVPDVLIGNPEILYLHRVKDGRDIYFLVNPTFAAQATEVELAGRIQPMVWDPSTGTERPIVPSRQAGGHTRFHLDLPPVGSAFVLAADPPPSRIVETDLVVERLDGAEVSGYGAGSHLVVERDGRQVRLPVAGARAPETLVLDGEWEFAPQDANALVLGHWLARAEAPGTSPADYAAPEVETKDWLPMVPGAWSYQLPAEPGRPYPIPVWYRVAFQAEYLPPRLDLIVDGFAGSEWQLFANGRPVTCAPVRSAIDSQMQVVDVAAHLREGGNTLAIRLAVAGPTDGLLDLLKLAGDFSLDERGDGSYAITAPRRTVRPAPWTEQGYPFFSGRATYRRRFDLPAGLAGRRIFLEPAMADDVLEVLVNGRPAGVRLWEPYAVEVTEFLQPGENLLELRVANTLGNLLDGVRRASGLAGPPRLVAYQPFSLELPA